MCFGGGKSSSPVIMPAPDPAPLPTPAPVPTISQPTVVDSVTGVTSVPDAERRRKAVQSMRYGLMSTIKTSPQGIKTGPDLYTPAAGGLKTTMGS